ncbi:Conserved_hypothetical protein [Hexamita inflata]|uniref:Uncharacterized protein n=1 Tax=Hexamita inflata TaxID=28002 RepID=A0AA86P7Y5_9EUKA|nr:Conserved hypothetical protein [Hexamita inflata]CAI9933511.1 Conserved hypothetical protein [Hexamita inflata]CAI9956938.1 Conserved hypothetical protein [Hexamita inflata]
MAENRLREKIATKKYSYNIVKELEEENKTTFKVVFFINQPAHPISQTVTFDFIVTDTIKFKTEGNVSFYNIEHVDIETIIDREYQQKLRFQVKV